MIAVIKEHHTDFSEAVSAATQRREPDQVADLQPTSKANEMIRRLGYRARLVVPLLSGDRIVGALVSPSPLWQAEFRQTDCGVRK